MFAELQRVFSNFLWLLGQALHVANPAFTLVVVGVTVSLGMIAIWKFPRDAAARKSLLYLLILPAPWILLGLWGACFWRSWGLGRPHNPDWVSWPISGLPIVFVLLWVALLIQLKGARVITLVFGLWNAYFVFVMMLLSAMATTGEWI